MDMCFYLAVTSSEMSVGVRRAAAGRSRTDVTWNANDQMSCKPDVDSVSREWISIAQRMPSGLWRFVRKLSSRSVKIWYNEGKQSLSVSRNVDRNRVYDQISGKYVRF